MTHPSKTEESAPLPRREGLGVSLLIPTYNYVCAHLVCELQKQCEEAQATLGENFRYEIIVADDGSTDAACVEKNAVIDYLPNCRYEVREANVGRAAIRNWLVGEARYEWVLIIDCDAEVVSDDFILRYCNETRKDAIVIGGLTTPQHCDAGCELRHRYELAAESMRTVEARRAEPAMFFSTFNFLCPRKILLEIPFDERCTEYGYEDALFGIEAEARGYAIEHIDNVLLHRGINTNAAFLANSEAALRTLRRLGPPMTDRARVARAARRFTSSALRRFTLLPLVLLLYKMSRPLLRRNLLSASPSLRLFAFYKLGYYLSLKD